jgi:hypothetical protein
MAHVSEIVCATPERCAVAGNTGKTNAQGAIVPNYIRLFATTNARRTWEPVRGLAASATLRHGRRS